MFVNYNVFVYRYFVRMRRKTRQVKVHSILSIGEKDGIPIGKVVIKMVQR